MRPIPDWIRRYILFHDQRHPAEMGAPEPSCSSIATSCIRTFRGSMTSFGPGDRSTSLSS